jgi:hypothetical protein
MFPIYVTGANELHKQAKNFIETSHYKVSEQGHICSRHVRRLRATCLLIL